MNKLSLAIAGAMALATPAIAQTALPRDAAQGLSDYPATTGSITGRENNTGGGERDVTIARGATGADTFQSNSAAGGNASRPERAIPNGSANGGGGGN